MKKTALFLLLGTLFSLSLTSCLDDDDDKNNYTAWKEQNEKYYSEQAARLGDDGKPFYEVLTPQWAPGYQALVKWHTPRKPGAMTPMDNSVCYVKYQVKDIEGNVIDDSYSLKTYGDSIYRTRPLSNVAGFWFTLTSMAEGDSVTAVVPYQAAYGQYANGNAKPYSTLIFSIKLKKIVAWEVPN